ncbi:MAG: 2-dehydropantoate 2-reductase [Bdellovibrionales bacterium]|nr:2-dehydropantoate 2-reductase [Bdellovibrionales bacterium]MBT3524805.1 2-dehydropantoate 2-reductase [Bdellovibrionales bacterium]MBT7767229.1 2-dehydropantoate 2-reductase [Bdellovibrionales bacterium]
MRIAVIGAGPMGGILAANLINRGLDVSLVDLNPQIKEQVEKSGLAIVGEAATKMQGELQTAPVTVASDLAELGEVDLVFVCIKSTFLHQLIPVMEKCWRSGTVVVSYQNGIDTEDMLAKVAGDDHTLRVVINYAGQMNSPGIYQVNWVTPPNYLGGISELATATHGQRVAELLNGAGIECKLVDKIKQFAFEKTVLNTTLCPICTLTGLTMGEAMELDATSSLVRVMLEEARVIGEHLGYQFKGSINQWMGYLSVGGNHRTSMAEDINAGRCSEIAFMNGKICDYGELLGVQTPYNNTMRALILGREANL